MTDDDKRLKATVRRVPRYPVFLALGAALGGIAALVMTSLIPPDPAIGFGSTFGYFAILGVTVGMLLGAVVALVLDRRSTRRARTVSIEVEKPRGEPDEPGR